MIAELEVLIIMGIGGIIGFLFGWIEGRHNPSKNTLICEYYEGRVDQHEGKPDKYEQRGGASR